MSFDFQTEVTFWTVMVWDLDFDFELDGLKF